MAGNEIAVKKYVVRLSAEERGELNDLIRSGKRSAQLLTKARILLKDLSDVHFPGATRIILVQDNLGTHTTASLYVAFPAAEARRLLERFGRVGRGLSPSASRRTVREALTSHRSHQANMPVTPSSQCTNSLRLLTAMDSINRPARIFAPL